MSGVLPQYQARKPVDNIGCNFDLLRFFRTMFVKKITELGDVSFQKMGYISNFEHREAIGFC
jgi:hypothetical protein